MTTDPREDDVSEPEWRVGAAALDPVLQRLFAVEVRLRHLGRATADETVATTVGEIECDVDAAIHELRAMLPTRPAGEVS